MKKLSILTIIIILLSINTQAQDYRVSHFTVKEGLSQSVIYCLYQDSRGFIWVGTQGGLNRFDGYSFIKFKHNPSDTTTISENWIYNITEDKDGNLWIGTRGGLCKYDFKSNWFTRYPHKPDYDNDPYRDNVYGCVVAEDGAIYTNTPPLINRFDPKTGNLTHYKVVTQVNPNVGEQSLPIIIDNNKEIWAATSFGLVNLNPKTNEKKIYNTQSSPIALNDNNILSIYEDVDGRIWVGMTGAINIVDKKNEKIIKSSINVDGKPAIINSIIEDNKGFYWLGTRGNGLLKIKLENDKVEVVGSIKSGDVAGPNYLNSSDIYSMIIDRSQNLWLGTLNGLDKTDLKDPRFRLYRKSNETSSVDLLDNVIASIYKDKEGKIWVGNWGKGLNIIDREKNKVEHFSTLLSGNNHLQNDYVHVIFEYNNEIWIGTRDGIFVYQNKRFVKFNDYYNTKKLPNLSGVRIFNIIKDNLNNVWIGTQGGLYYIDFVHNSYKLFTSSGEKGKHISDNLVYSLAIDFNKDLWIATKNGLDRYSYKTDSIANFKRDEKSNNTINDNYVITLCYASDSTLWIGTYSGVNHYNIKQNKFEYYTEEQGLASNSVYGIIEDDYQNLWFSTGKGLSQLKKKDKNLKTFSEEDGLQGEEFNLNAKYKCSDGEIFFGGMNGFNLFNPHALSENKYIPPIEFTSFQKQNNEGIENIHVTNGDEITLRYGDFAFNVEFSALEFTSPNKNMYSYRFAGDSNEWINLGNRRFLPFSNLPDGKYSLWIKGSNNDGVWNNKGVNITINILPPWWRSKVAYVIYILTIILGVIVYVKRRERNLKEQKALLEQKVKERTEEVEKQKNEIVDKNFELEQQNCEILAQRDTLTMQNEKISKQNKQIKDSIQYASRIQSAILPSTSILDKNGIDHFLIFKPKDIVSGDFYWIKQIQDHLLLAVSDCTGHGVPGAFMSMLGNAFLNEIVSHSEVTKTNEVLENLRDLIITSLAQSGDDTITRDGMDISLCEINLQNLHVQFAGAYNPMLIVRDGEIITLNADRFPVGYHFKASKSFKNTDFQLQKGDAIYLFTDGILDQFGGEWGYKFMLRKLKSTLLDIHKLPMKSQKEALDRIIDEWMGQKYDQIDDITIFGVRIN